MAEVNSFESNKPRIDLMLNQVGVIIMFNSGVVYHNQTCGTACMQRFQEGVLVLPTDPLLVIDAPFEVYQCPIEAALRKMTWYAIRGIDSERADEIDTLLKSNGFTSGIAVDRTRLQESEEAWVYVILEPGEYFAYSGFGRCQGVLVWTNSD
jgi:Family of unknown function (DUF6210)